MSGMARRGWNLGAVETVLDKFLFLRGGDIPDEWSINGEDEEQRYEEAVLEKGVLYYPTVSFSTPWIAGRHPVMLGLAGEEEGLPTRPKQQQTLTVGQEE